MRRCARRAGWREALRPRCASLGYRAGYKHKRVWRLIRLARSTSRTPSSRKVRDKVRVPLKHPKISDKNQYDMYTCGGGGGIRTHGRVPPASVFKTGAIDHSATPPTGAAYAAAGDSEREARQRFSADPAQVGTARPFPRRGKAGMFARKAGVSRSKKGRQQPGPDGIRRGRYR